MKKTVWTVTSEPCSLHTQYGCAVFPSANTISHVCAYMCECSNVNTTVKYHK